MTKSSKWKRGLALGLSVCMIMTAAACTNKSGNDGNNPNGGGSKASSDPYANAQLAKEYVYSYKDLNLGSEADSDLNVVAARKEGDRLELLANQYVWEDDYEGQILTLFSMKKDGTDIKSIKLTMPADASEGTDGETQEPSADAVPDGGDGEDYEYQPYESTNYGQAALSGKNIFVFQNHYKESFENDAYVTEEEQALCCWDKEGNFLWKTPIDMSKYQNDDSYSYISNLIAIDDDTVGILMNGDQSGIINVKADGTVSDLKKANTEKDIFANSPSFAPTKDDKLLVAYYNDDWSKQYITVFDPKSGSVEQEYEVPRNAQMYGFDNFTSGDKFDVLYSNSEGVFGFNLGDQDITKVMDYVNSDLATYNLNNMVSIDENSFLASYSDPTDYRNVFSLFTYVKPEDVKEKKTLVLGCVGMDSDIKVNVIRFNKESDEYRITIKDYFETDENYDSSQGYTKLNNEIIAGNMPDILLVNPSMPLDSYIAKGLLANVDELIKNDAELSQQEYFDNVFEAYRINDALYQVIPKFNVTTCIAKKSLVGDRKTWTMDEVKEAASKLNGDKKIFGNELVRDSFMNYMVMRFCGSDFVDLKTGKCNFDTKLFADFLDYAKTLPESEEDGGYDEDYWQEFWEKYYTQYRDNESLIYELSIGNVSNMVTETKGMFGEDIAYIGFPTESDCGSYIEIYTSFAISSKSVNQDGAWKFLRFFLTKDYQENKDNKYGYAYGLPILKSMVREQIDTLKERPFWEDEDGHKEYYDYTMWMNGDSIVLDPFTQAEADQLYDFICSVTKPAYYDENVIKIVSEETGSFFSGSKSAKDVAGMIQNRVQLYINENR